jgi:hypothetical protein
MSNNNLTELTDTDIVNFNKVGLPIPEMVHKLTNEKQREILEYYKNMDERDKKAYIIAFNHLGTSFNICKSNGYKEWKKKC